MMKKMMQRPLLLSLFSLLLIAVAGCGAKPADTTGNVDMSGAASHPIVTIEMDSGKKFKLELYPEVAPNTVNNFISLVKSGFYDGTTFHRVIPDFMIQGGDPNDIGTDGPGYSIKGEFNSNGAENNLKHTTGVLSMARLEDPDSAGSQFFITVADAPHLDGNYAAFGKVIEGMDVVNEIVNLPREAEDKPKNPPVMKKVMVDTLGKEYPEPEKIQ
ncbi:peptidylprolyl isomerase [Paenibacillus sp. TH7-28]